MKKHSIVLLLLLTACTEPCCVHNDYPNSCDKWIREHPDKLIKGWAWCPANGKVI